MSPHLAGGHVIAGYIQQRNMTSLERKLVRTCVAARYTVSLINNIDFPSQVEGVSPNYSIIHTGHKASNYFCLVSPTMI